MTKRKPPLQEVLERGAPEYCLFHCRCAILVSSPQASAGFLSIHSTISSQGLIPRLSETPSLLDFRHTLGNDSVLQCVLHQYLNGSYWYSVFEIGCSKHICPLLIDLFSTQDSTLVCCFGAPSLRGIGRHPSMPSA